LAPWAFYFWVLDDSFLFLPFGNDLLMVALTARNHLMLPIFAGIATAGSVLGCMLLDWVVRKGGKEGLSKIISGRQLSYVKRKVKKRVGCAVAIACVMPPPFPFTGIVAGGGFSVPSEEFASHNRHRAPRTIPYAWATCHFLWETCPSVG